MYPAFTLQSVGHVENVFGLKLFSFQIRLVFWEGQMKQTLIPANQEASEEDPKLLGHFLVSEFGAHHPWLHPISISHVGS